MVLHLCPTHNCTLHTHVTNIHTTHMSRHREGMYTGSLTRLQCIARYYAPLLTFFSSSSSSVFQVNSQDHIALFFSLSSLEFFFGVLDPFHPGFSAVPCVAGLLSSTWSFGLFIPLRHCL